MLAIHTNPYLLHCVIYSRRNQSDDRAFSILVIPNSRKVRAPVDRPPGNPWALITRVISDGKCHRKQTAIYG
jgi:hypothetical protein